MEMVRHDYSFILFCTGIALIVIGFILGYKVDEGFSFLFVIGVFTAIASAIWDLTKALKQEKAK